MGLSCSQKGPCCGVPDGSDNVGSTTAITSKPSGSMSPRDFIGDAATEPAPPARNHVVELPADGGRDGSNVLLNIMSKAAAPQDQEQQLDVYVMKPFKLYEQCDPFAEAQLEDLGLRAPNYFERDLPELGQMAEAPVPMNGRQPPLRFRSGAVYTGQWRDNARHGYGVQHWPDGAKYEGEWSANCAEGMGRFVHSNGDAYVGQWRLNAAHGMGVYTHREDSTAYVGQWLRDLQDGCGAETYADGSRYRGFFREGQKEGSGVQIWADGSQYRGSWAANALSGPGEYNGSDGRWFQGTWRDSEIHGLGKYLWPDGKKYEGQYVYDRKHGFGVFSWPDGGPKYEGFWLAGRQHGPGRCTFHDGRVDFAMWMDGNQNRGEESAARSSSPRYQVNQE